MINAVGRNYAANMPVVSNVQPVGGGGNLSTAVSKPDEFVSNKKEGKKLSTTAKAGIGILAVGGLIAAAVLTRGKSLKNTKLAEEITFKPAKTIEEARAFAKENLGVNLKVNDLDICNYVNSRLVMVNNFTKGKSVMPKKVVIQDIKSADGLEGFASWSKGTLSLSHSWEKIADGARRNNHSLLEIDKFLSKEPEMAKCWQYCDKTIAHELGHANHFKHCKDARKMHRIAENEAYGITDHHFTREFFKDIEGNEVIKNFHNEYGLSSPCEFVAETFSYLVQGRKIPEDVLKIYRKYGGPLV